MSNENLKAISDNYLRKIKRESVTPNRQNTSGIVSTDNKSGSLLENGTNKTITDTLNQSKGSSESQSQTDICYEKNTITNRLNIKTDDIFVNNNRLNPILFSSTLFSQNDICTQGDLNLFGTVLVKAWDKSLNKVVYIRRQIRFPVAYPTTQIADIDPQFGIPVDSNGGTL